MRNIIKNKTYFLKVHDKIVPLVESSIYAKTKDGGNMKIGVIWGIFFCDCLINTSYLDIEKVKMRSNEDYYKWINNGIAKALKIEDFVKAGNSFEFIYEQNGKHKKISNIKTTDSLAETLEYLKGLEVNFDFKPSKERIKHPKKYFKIESIVLEKD